MKKRTKKACRFIGGALVAAAGIGLIFAGCSFDNGDITYGQAWARLLTFAIIAFAGGLIYEHYEEKEDV